MIVMTPLNGLGATVPVTNFEQRRINAARVRALSQMGGSRLQIQPRGMGALDAVPRWAWGAGGGLVAGLVIGALVFKKKRR